MSEDFKWPFPQPPVPLWWKISSSITLATVATLSKLWLNCLNSTKIYKKDVLKKAVWARPKGVSLVTGNVILSCYKFHLLGNITLYSL